MNAALRFWSIVFLMSAVLAGETLRSLDRARAAVAQWHDTPRSAPVYSLP